MALDGSCIVCGSLPGSGERWPRRRDRRGRGAGAGAVLTVALVLVAELAEDDVADPIARELVLVAPAVPHPDSATQITIAISGRTAEQTATHSPRSQNTLCLTARQTAVAAT